MATSRLALVTGSTSGIGLAITKVFSTRGYDLVLNGVGSPSEVTAALKECQKMGASRTEHHGADLTDPKQITHLFNFISEKWGRGPDILVNNAGMQYVSPIEDFPVEKWDKVIALNLSTAFHTIKHALPGMKERGWGRIVNISSAFGLTAAVNKSAYVASKHGLIGLTKVTALETAGTGITSNAVCPGWVSTPLSRPQIERMAQERGEHFEKTMRDYLSDKQPTKEPILPEEIGSIVAYLCSDEARQITGSSLSVDGGWTAM